MKILKKIGIGLVGFVYMNHSKFNTKSDNIFSKKYIAHRGLFNNKENIPENSLLAFEKACNYNIGIELDVQKTKDNKLVVFHDWNLKRAALIDKNISEMTLEEIQKIKIFGSNEVIPTFNQVLKIVNNRCPLVIEIKEKNNVSLICELVNKELKMYCGEYCIESFNPLVLRWFKKYNPLVKRGQLSTNFRKDESVGFFLLDFMLTHMLFNFITKPDFIAYNIKYKYSFGFLLNKYLEHTATFAWTVKNSEDERILKNEFDYIIFDSYIPNDIVEVNFDKNI